MHVIITSTLLQPDIVAILKEEYSIYMGTLSVYFTGVRKISSFVTVIVESTIAALT